MKTLVSNKTLVGGATSGFIVDGCRDVEARLKVRYRVKLKVLNCDNMYIRFLHAFVCGPSSKIDLQWRHLPVIKIMNTHIWCTFNIFDHITRV